MFSQGVMSSEQTIRKAYVYVILCPCIVV